MSGAATLRQWARAMPTLLRISAAETLAYRFQFLIWMLTNTLPLVMLGLWTTVADEAPFGRFQEADFVAYYLAALIVRMVTGSWVVWQINEEVRMGTLSMRLLKPIHPFVTYASDHLAAIPLRAAIALPIAVGLLVSAAGDRVATDPVMLAVFGVSLVGAWAITFFAMVAIGATSFWLERSVAIFDIYLGVSAVLSGYLVPLELLPAWVQSVAAALPFEYMLAFPVEALTGARDRGAALQGLALQWMFVVAIGAVALAAWRAGVRRYEAYGA